MVALLSLATLALGTGAAVLPRQPQSVTIHPHDASLCLTSTGQGTAIKLSACDGSDAQKWDVDGCTGQVKAAGSDNCLQAGWNPRVEQWFPAPGMTTVLQPCRDTDGFTWLRTAQEGSFEYEHTQEKIGARLCLDWKDGEGEVVQTWDCVAGNDNQRWSTRVA